MEKSVNRHDLVSGVFWLGLSLFVSVMAVQLGIGPFSNPGPGFVLFWSSLGFGSLSVVLVARALSGKAGKRMLADSWKGLKWTHVLATVAALFLYAAFLTRVGFLLLTFALMVFLYALGKPRLWITVAGSLVTVLLAYALFHFALQIEFPRGILG